MTDAEPKPHLATASGALPVVIREIQAALEAGECDNPILGYTVMLDLIRQEAMLTRLLEGTTS